MKLEVVFFQLKMVFCGGFHETRKEGINMNDFEIFEEVIFDLFPNDSAEEIEDYFFDVD